MTEDWAEPAPPPGATGAEALITGLIGTGLITEEERYEQVVKVWQDYADLGAMPDRDAESSEVVFGGKQMVLARSVIPSRALLHLHREIAEATVGSTALPAHVEPGAWTPHVTLARRVEPARLGEAIALLGTDVIQGRCGAIRRWDGEQKTEWLLTPPL